MSTGEAQKVRRVLEYWKKRKNYVGVRNIYE